MKAMLENQNQAAVEQALALLSDHDAKVRDAARAIIQSTLAEHVKSGSPAVYDPMLKEALDHLKAKASDGNF